MNGSVHNEALCLERLLGLRFTWDFKWNYIPKDAANRSVLCTRLQEIPDSSYHALSLQEPGQNQTWNIAALLSSRDGVRERLRALVGDGLLSTLQSLSHSQNVSSLSILCRYFHWRHSGEIHSLAPYISQRVFKNTQDAYEHGEVRLKLKPKSTT